MNIEKIRKHLVIWIPVVFEEGQAKSEIITALFKFSVSRDVALAIVISEKLKQWTPALHEEQIAKNSILAELRKEILR